MEIGVQISSLKPLLGTPAQVEEAFARLGRLGCRSVQLQWIDPAVPIPVIARALAENGLSSVSVQDLYEAVEANPEYYVNLNAATGGKWLCVSRIPERFKTRRGLECFALELEGMEKTLRGLGQGLCFHPVSADFRALPDGNAVELLLDALPWLPLCLDLYHLNRCCGDLPGYLRRRCGRVEMLHFKDSRAGELVPAGQGDTNWAGAAQAARDTGVPYAFVEQEQWEGDPFDCLGQALDWLRGQLRREERP